MIASNIVDDFISISRYLFQKIVLMLKKGSSGLYFITMVKRGKWVDEMEKNRRRMKKLMNCIKSPLIIT